MSKFYAIEYFIDGEIDIKHAEMTDQEVTDLTKMLNEKGIKYTIYDLSKNQSALDVSSINGDRSFLGRQPPTNS